MTDARLRHIQTLQYADKQTAESLLLVFICETFPQLAARAVELRPSAVSLNSFNGDLILEDGRRLFFKTHVEPDSIVNEYYNSGLLAEAGYPIIRPLYASTEYGKQFLIYERIESPSVFEIARALEVDSGSPLSLAVSLADLQTAQNRADDHLYQIYEQTLAEQSAVDAAKAPIHQLFYHRLAGARYRDFYGAPDNPLVTLLDRHWIINGRHYRSTLRELIGLQHKIAPEQAAMSVIGHGDAHNGNVFYQPDGLLYFDPAFAGRHNPLLDIAKPLFHNVFASWMYHPAAHPQALTIRLQAPFSAQVFGSSGVVDQSQSITMTYDETLPAVRHMFFDSKVERVLTPLVISLKQRGQLSAEWRLYLKMALLCCPLLTMNLTNLTRFPAEAAWLGASYAIQIGSESDGGSSLLDQALNNIEAVL